jgi:hypothetical protein
VPRGGAEVEMLKTKVPQAPRLVPGKRSAI